MSDTDVLAKAIQSHYDREKERRVRVVAVRRSRSRVHEDLVPSSVACLGLSSALVHRVGAERWVLLLEAAGRRVRAYLCESCADDLVRRKAT